MLRQKCRDEKKPYVSIYVYVSLVFLYPQFSTPKSTLIYGPASVQSYSLKQMSGTQIVLQTMLLIVVFIGRYKFFLFATRSTFSLFFLPFKWILFLSNDSKDSFIVHQKEGCIILSEIVAWLSLKYFFVCTTYFKIQ